MGLNMDHGSVRSRGGSTLRLARRLRALREEHWPDQSITQGQLAQAFSSDKPVSVPLISSWESLRNPKILPKGRLSAYATFFATKRSVNRSPFRLMTLAELSPQEKDARNQLLMELTKLRDAAVNEAQGQSSVMFSGPFESLWHFPDRPVTIVCAQLPPDMYKAMPYTAPSSPDYVELYNFADPDALIEIHGHIRALNPTGIVNFRTAQALTDDDYANHLVVLGGVDWNQVTRDIMRRLPFPVRQIPHISVSPRDGVEISYFETTGEGESQVFQPTVLVEGEHSTLTEDIALFYRGPSPYNSHCTVTLCSGIFARGTLGAVRSITDPRFRKQNEEYLRHRFAGQKTFCILSRVPLVNGKLVTPDWTSPRMRLHEWPAQG